MRLRSLAAALLPGVAVALAFAGGIQAATINVTLAGTIDHVDSQLSSAFTVGDPFTASFQIDSATPDSNADPTLGSYAGAMSNLSFTFGSYTGTGAGSGNITILNSEPFGFDPDYILLSNGVSAASIGGLPPVEFYVELTKFAATALSSDAIPTSLDLADFDAPTPAALFFGSAYPFAVVMGPVASLGYTVVPEPGTLLLVGLGFAGLARRRRRI